ncbi:hypothetical protein RSAG8_09850, partial [Rhizoctonia solani AG-8 WAC10335]
MRLMAQVSICGKGTAKGQSNSDGSSKGSKAVETGGCESLTEPPVFKLPNCC